MIKLGWVSYLLLAVNIFFCALLIAALAAPYFDPIDFWWPSLFALGFIELFAINLFFFVFWLIFRNQYSLISAFFLVFGLTELPNHFQLNFSEKPWNKKTNLLSLNVRNFDLYNWTENRKTRDKILMVIDDSEADIICLQEFFNTTDSTRDFTTLDTILDFEREYQGHVEYTATVKETEHFGIATFSTYPIVEFGRIDFEASSNNICIYTDLLIEGDTFRLYNLHLASVKFAHQDYEYLEEVVDRSIDPNMEINKSLLKKLRTAFHKRAKQVHKVEAHVSLSPHPVIICGDFNDTPASYSYNKLSKHLNDSFRQKGNGFGATYNGNLPFLRIDYVLADPSITILDHEIMQSNISDHYPLRVGFEIRK